MLPWDYKSTVTRTAKEKDTMKFALITLGRQAAEMLLVAVQSPGVIAVFFCLIPIGILHK